MPESQVMSREELVLAEARFIATDLIERELSKDNLPLPKDSALDAHIDALLSARPDLIDLARERVNAKTDGYRKSLESLGIEPVIAEVLDL